MTDVLHLIDGPPRPLTLRLIADAARTPGHRHRVWLLGGAAMAYAARAVGLGFDRRVSTPFGNAVFGWPALRAAWRRAPRPNLIHCWTPTTHRAARLLRQPDAAVIGPDNLGPAADAAQIDPAARDAIRREWGAGPSTRVVALLSDDPDNADAYRAMMVVALTYESTGVDGEPMDLRLLVTPRQRGRPHARRMLDEFGKAEMLMQDSRLAAPWSVLPGCDAALVLGPRGAPLASAWAAAAGVPLVNETAPDDLRTMSQQLTDVLTDPDAAARCIDQGRASAATFHVDRLHAKLNELYR